MTSLIRNLLSQRNLLINNKAGLTFRFCSDNLPKGQVGHRVNNLEKKFLVWTGKYKSVEDVPGLVPQSVVERARNRMRIRIANYMMAATAIGCIIMIISGKRAAKEGNTVPKQTLDWHKQLKEEYKESK